MNHNLVSKMNTLTSFFKVFCLDTYLIYRKPEYSLECILMILDLISVSFNFNSDFGKVRYTTDWNGLRIGRFHIQSQTWRLKQCTDRGLTSVDHVHICKATSEGMNVANIRAGWLITQAKREIVIDWVFSYIGCACIGSDPRSNFCTQYAKPCIYLARVPVFGY